MFSETKIKMLRYKACENSIVTLELLNDTKNNEKRKGVFNDKYAKFRCDRARVVSITNVETGEKINSDRSFHDWDFQYILGEIVKTDFDEDINKVCAEGIHYFKTKEAALSWFYNHEFPDGKWIEWHENGQKLCEGTYKDGKKDGKWIYWSENGKKGSEGTYKDGKDDGKWIFFWSNGQKHSEGTWKNEVKNGKWIYWDKNGQKNYEGTYKDGKFVGKWIYWDENGQELK